MMAAMAAAVSAVSTVRLASEVGLLGRLGLVDDERAGELVVGADAGTADDVTVHGGSDEPHGLR